MAIPRESEQDKHAPQYPEEPKSLIERLEEWSQLTI